jgi:hypothetical protein
MLALSCTVRRVVSAIKQLPDGVQQLLIDDRITLVRIVNGENNSASMVGYVGRHLLRQQSRQPRCVLSVAFGCPTVASRFSLASSGNSPL